MPTQYSNPLQYSCLENPMEGGAWQATVHGVAKSWTWLRDWAYTYTELGLSERWLGLCRPLSTPTPLRRGSAFPLLGQLWLGTHGVVLSACLFRPKGWRHCPTITHLGWGHPLVGPWLWPHTANRHPSCAIQWKPGRVTICDTHTLSDHPLLCMVASGMLHNLTVPQFPSSVKCLLRVVDRPCWYTEGA